MERKKVAILLPWLKMGGTNKIALNFINELIQYCDVTLILSENTGELLQSLPEKVHLIIDKMDSFKQIVRKDVHALRIIYLLRDCSYYAKIKAGKDGVHNYKYIVGRHDYISEEEYDCAVSYHGQSPERLLNLLYRIHAKKKAVWIHGEMSFPERIMKEMSEYYKKVDHFFFVSNPTRRSFVEHFPFVEKKSTVYYNPIDRAEILEKAGERFYPEFSDQFINLLTVGRLSKEKGQDMIPAIMRSLLDAGYSVRWYLIGDGDTRRRIEDSIREHHVETAVFLLGTKTNPYCYMRACDIYIQPSYTEGYSTTICEAGILGKAIIGTEPSGGIRDQIKDGEDGMIVEASIEGLTNGIERLIIDKALLHQFEEKIRSRDFEGKGEITKFLKYINDSN